MNRVTTPNMASIIATEWFSKTVMHEIQQRHTTKWGLARVAHVECKTMYDWINGVRSPRLENVAQIFAALGYDSITIPLKEVKHDNLL